MRCRSLREANIGGFSPPRQGLPAPADRHSTAKKCGAEMKERQPIPTRKFSLDYIFHSPYLLMKAVDHLFFHLPPALHDIRAWLLRFYETAKDGDFSRNPELTIFFYKILCSQACASISFRFGKLWDTSWGRLRNAAAPAHQREVKWRNTQNQRWYINHGSIRCSMQKGT